MLYVITAIRMVISALIVQTSRLVLKLNLFFVFETDLTPKNSISTNGHLFNYPVKVLLDTGCTSIIVKESLIPKCVKRGRLVTLYDFLGVGRSFPEVRCFIKCEFFNGWVNAVAAPIKFADILIGMVPGVDMTKINATVNEFKKAGDTVHNSETIMAIQTRLAKLKESHENKSLAVPKLSLDDISRKDLIDAQNECPTLKHIRSAVDAKTVINVKNRSVKFERINGMVYRIGIKSKVDYGLGTKQLVVLSKFKRYVLSIAHDSLISGHFSHRKTSNKVFKKFYLPGAGADFKRYCRSCHICQKTFKDKR